MARARPRPSGDHSVLVPALTAGKLRAVPESPPKALGLVRVSKEREGMISPEVQRVAIADYATARGYEVAGWLEGIDESGSRAKSAWWPRLEQAVAAVEAGEYDVIVVWKYSRVARQRLRWAVAIDRVEDAGGRLESATEQVDTTTSTGRFTRGMLAELQAFEAERIGEVWKEVHSRRVTAGKPASGKPKWGYAYDPVKKLHLPDPKTGQVLADLYRRYVAGETIYGLVRWLNGQGWRTSSDGLWSDRALRRVLDSGFASGRFMVNGTLRQGIHKPLIDERLWQTYVDARARRRALPARRERSEYLFSGLVRCGRCGGTMVAGQFGHAREPKYRCKTRQQQGPAGCQGGYVMASLVERKVIEWLEEKARAGRVDVARGDAAAIRARRTNDRHARDRLARELRRVEENLHRLVTQDHDTLPPRVYAEARDALAERHRDLTAALEEAQRDLRDTVTNPAKAAAGLLASWDRRPVEHRRELLRRLVGEIRVWSARPRSEVKVFGRWELA